MNNELRYGFVTQLYYETLGIETPRQLDLLDEWFSDLLIKEEASDGNTKSTPYFSQEDSLIHAVRYRGRLYSGADEIIAQLTGRLIGTAKGNREKQRRNAVVMQKHVTRRLSLDWDRFEEFLNHTGEMILKMDEEQINEFLNKLFGFVSELAYAREALSESERDGEPFPMDDEIFDTVVYNAAYQLNLCTIEGLVQGYAWLLLGSLLRNEAGRITRRFDSSFNEVNRMPSEEPDLVSRLDCLFFPEDYEYTYDGDDFESPFPDIRWQCDACGASLNAQEGFTDRYGMWQCRLCGHVNEISAEHIYENMEDVNNARNHMDAEKMRAAVERRKKQLTD
jgi:hypothetical protein